ncbi:guanine nucleotide exchange factor for Rab-3A isoform X2 [Amia ocellicauda]|uniref:guanine nucleotide exchange factor for Rab-3A isoform X2 n=1 Tax=Amia ocellicauda TaxID=2972642 RepID=UPI0034640DED
MDSLEGLHTVRSASPPPRDPSGPGYEVLVSRDSGIAVYSSPALFGQSGRGLPNSAPKPQGERCAVGRLVDLEPERGAGAEGRSTPMEAGEGERYSLSRLRSSSLEIREKGSEILREQLNTAQKELRLKDEECERLSRVREQLEQELEELTASLFEEAHKMVREANTKQAAAEKQLKEAQGKIDVLQAEVLALKTLVLTSTPSSPNPQLHPQLLSPSRGGSPRRGGHTRNKSASAAVGMATAAPDPPPAPKQPMGSEEDRESAVPALLSLILCIVPGRSVHVTYEPCWQDMGEGPGPYLRQMDAVLFAEFLSWRERPSLERSSAFLSRVYAEDISPCLAFTRTELSEAVHCAVESNSVCIEPVGLQALPVVKAAAVEQGGPKKCALSGMSRPCRHRIRLGDTGGYYYISPSSRARITAVCNFFTYIRYIQQGLVRQEAEQMFWEVMRLRREMGLAKLGFYVTDEG